MDVKIPCLEYLRLLQIEIQGQGNRYGCLCEGQCILVHLSLFGCIFHKTIDRAQTNLNNFVFKTTIEPTCKVFSRTPSLTHCHGIFSCTAASLFFDECYTQVPV